MAAVFNWLRNHYSFSWFAHATDDGVITRLIADTQLESMMPNVVLESAGDAEEKWEERMQDGGAIKRTKNAVAATRGYFVRVLIYDLLFGMKSKQPAAYRRVKDDEYVARKMLLMTIVTD